MVKSFSYMFFGAAAFNQDLSEWNVGNGRFFRSMFYKAATFNQDLSGWNVKKCRDFSSMFKEAGVFNQDISEWNVAKGRKFFDMFEGASAFNQDLSEWNVTNGRNFINMFKNSGMNYFIGEWDFKSMRNDPGRISVFFSMLGVTKYDDMSNDELKQLNEFIFGTCSTK